MRGLGPSPDVRGRHSDDLDSRILREIPLGCNKSRRKGGLCLLSLTRLLVIATVCSLPSMTRVIASASHVYVMENVLSGHMFFALAYTHLHLPSLWLGISTDVISRNVASLSLVFPARALHAVVTVSYVSSCLRFHCPVGLMGQSPSSPSMDLRFFGTDIYLETFPRSLDCETKLTTPSPFGFVLMSMPNAVDRDSDRVAKQVTRRRRRVTTICEVATRGNIRDQILSTST